jgi:hypothetical protein
MPENAFGAAAQVDCARARLTVFVARPQLGRTLENLADNGLLAVVLSRLSDYRTYQLKGHALSWRDARDEERPFVDAFHERFARGAEWENLGDTLRRMAVWPAVAIEMQVREIFAQTPGPGTGKRLPS